MLKAMNFPLIMLLAMLFRFWYVLVLFLLFPTIYVTDAFIYSYSKELLEWLLNVAIFVQSNVNSYFYFLSFVLKRQKSTFWNVLKFLYDQFWKIIHGILFTRQLHTQYFHIHISQGTLISFIVFFRISISLPFDFCLMIFQRPREVWLCFL